MSVCCWDERKATFDGNDKSEVAYLWPLEKSEPRDHSKRRGYSWNVKKKVIINPMKSFIALFATVL